MRPQNIDLHKLGLVRTFFWIQIAKRLHHVDLIISVDETTLNRSTYNSYGWGPKGRLKETHAMAIRGRISIISAILSDGSRILKLSDSNTNGDSFIEFANELRRFIRSKKQHSNKSIMLIIDNASYHKSSKVTSYLKSVFKVVFFIPPYTPRFNPIELYFRNMKAILWKRLLKSAIKLFTEQGKLEIERMISEVEPASIIGWFSKTIRNMSEFLTINHF